ncbi:response regulator [Agarilytica rhodophyticola]|uniref:response regulator n=1 Tax=Agarilytica rhodophyticola TaxID=1737490 RepID=UPI000B34380B|nr:response regulator [Agarilytica rhodophyticola]
MAKSHIVFDPDSDIDTVSATFAHNISTPLTIAQLNADLLKQYFEAIMQTLETKNCEAIPEHLRPAIEKAPELIYSNLESIQRTLVQYKSYLNAQHNKANDKGAAKQESVALPREGNYRILLVDDEDIHHDIGEAALGSSHTITHALSGRLALKECQSSTFDIILMDIQMPELAGPQTVEQLRSFINKNTLIIGLSNMPIHSQREELIRCGFNGFLDKPLKRDSFNDLIASLTN